MVVIISTNPIKIMEKLKKITINDGIILYESKFAKHTYQPSTKTLFSDWSPATFEMSREDFKIEIEAWLNVFKKEKILYLFDRCSDFIYPIAPDEQIWMANLLNPEWIKLGLKKYAHLVPEEFIANLSVDQMFDEFFNMNLEGQYPINHFSDEQEQEALDWLIKS